MTTISNKYFYFSLCAITIVCLTASGLAVMDPDAGQYAEISREMLFSKNPLQLFCLGTAYLDKPPLLFWLTAVCFKIFGIENFAYRLPSLLFAILAVFSTYRFAKLFYEENTARIAALMLASTHAFFLLTNDVRTDTMLMGAVIFSLWQLASYLQNQKLSHLILGAVGISLAMLTKGPIGLFIPVYALLPYLILQKEWKKIFDWKYLIAVAVIIVFLLPMSLGLYQQYGKEGLRFYFWIQSFGRITGENVWHNNPDPLFLIHTTLWAFLPWSLFLFAGIFLQLKILFTAKEKQPQNIIPLLGFILTLVSLMLSKYQLPHYIFVVYPLGAVIAADTFVRLSSKKWTQIIQLILVIGLWFFIALINIYVFPSGLWAVALLLICAAAAGFLFYSNRNILLLSIGTIVTGNLLMNVNVYPTLLKYQPSQEIGSYLREHHIPSEKFREYNAGSLFSLAFYYQNIFQTCNSIENIEATILEQKEMYVLTDENHYHELITHAGWKTELIKTCDKFGITQLNLPFLNPNTRAEAVQKIYFVKLTLE